VSGVGEARAILERAIARRKFPAAAVEVGASTAPLWTDALGALTYDADSPGATADTPFDLASLTKPLATATVFMELTRTGRVRLDEPVSAFFPDWSTVDRERVTVRDLLEHASGLPARLVDRPPRGRREFEHEICRTPLEYTPRTRALYSDLDFILLGFIAEDRGGAPLGELFRDRAGGEIDERRLTFSLPAELKALAAPTMPGAEDPRRGRTLAGEVHDDYAAALGGAAGHAGLFGSASAVGRFARAILRAARGAADLPAPFFPDSVALFTTRSTVPGSSRALAWDTMLPTSSCGAHMSPRAFGHVGFTGTSLWIDPERDRYFVLLTNRAFGDGSLDDMRAIRRAFHDELKDF
jgi:CubicO group peptidase (beta-lactamase class C family)